MQPIMKNDVSERQLSSVDSTLIVDSTNDPRRFFGNVHRLSTVGYCPFFQSQLLDMFFTSSQVVQPRVQDKSTTATCIAGPFIANRVKTITILCARLSLSFLQCVGNKPRLWLQMHCSSQPLIPRTEIWHASSHFLRTRQFWKLHYQSDLRHVIFHVTAQYLTCARIDLWQVHIVEMAERQCIFNPSLRWLGRAIQ